MSYWNAKYKNDYGEYEITFASKQKEETKAVEKLCQAIIDKRVKSADDVAIVRHGRWNVEYPTGSDFGRCSACKTLGNLDWHYCPNCGAKMRGESDE